MSALLFAIYILVRVIPFLAVATLNGMNSFGDDMTNNKDKIFMYTYEFISSFKILHLLWRN